VITVPKRWPEETFVLIGGGPSLTLADVRLVHGHARVIAINDAYRLAPWADVLYAADQQWWTWHNGVPSFTGPKYAIASSDPVTWPDVQVLQNTGQYGLELEPTGLRAGFNSGYQAINLAVHLGARRIILLGYDMAPAANGLSHWFGEHPGGKPSPYPQMRDAFDSLIAPLEALGIWVWNCSRVTALTAFPVMRLEDVFAECAA
jgi:hypothetical protein